jgi:hypothetical protein
VSSLLCLRRYYNYIIVTTSTTGIHSNLSNLHLNDFRQAKVSASEVSFTLICARRVTSKEKDKLKLPGLAWPYDLGQAIGT